MHPTEGLLQAYVGFLAATCAADAVSNQLAGLKFYLGTFGPVDWSHFVRLRRLLKGLRRSTDSGRQQKRPVTMQLLLLCVLRLRSSWDSRVQCLVLACIFGVFGMLRRSSLA
jgi:hypothetical protein